MPYLLLSLGVTGCDHATKLVANSQLPSGHAIRLIAGVLSLEQARNSDTAFSMLASVLPTEPRLLLLKTTATAGSLFILMLATTRFARATWLERAGFAFLLGGAVGNAVDRWRWGYVIDFIRLEYWPTFNVADIALCVGGGLLLLSAWRGSSAHVTPEPPL